MSNSAPLRVNVLIKEANKPYTYQGYYVGSVVIENKVYAIVINNEGKFNTTPLENLTLFNY